MTAPCAWLRALLGLTIWLPTSPTTHILWTFILLFASTLSSTTSAKYPRCANWNATPFAVPFGNWLREFQPDFSATSSRTLRMRAASISGSPGLSGILGFCTRCDESSSNRKATRHPGPHISPHSVHDLGHGCRLPRTIHFAFYAQYVRSRVRY